MGQRPRPGKPVWFRLPRCSGQTGAASGRPWHWHRSGHATPHARNPLALLPFLPPTHDNAGLSCVATCEGGLATIARAETWRQRVKGRAGGLQPGHANPAIHGINASRCVMVDSLDTYAPGMQAAMHPLELPVWPRQMQQPASSPAHQCVIPTPLNLDLCPRPSCD